MTGHICNISEQKWNHEHFCEFVFLYNYYDDKSPIKSFVYLYYMFELYILHFVRFCLFFFVFFFSSIKKKKKY